MLPSSFPRHPSIEYRTCSRIRHFQSNSPTPWKTVTLTASLATSRRYWHCRAEDPHGASLSTIAMETLITDEWNTAKTPTAQNVTCSLSWSFSGGNEGNLSALPSLFYTWNIRFGGVGVCFIMESMSFSQLVLELNFCLYSCWKFRCFCFNSSFIVIDFGNELCNAVLFFMLRISEISFGTFRSYYDVLYCCKQLSAAWNRWGISWDI